MILQFRADEVAVGIDEFNVLVVAFGASDHYFMIQETLDEYDEQDIQLGMNTYYIERDDQRFCNYGGVRRILLQRNLVEVELDEKGKENLRCDVVKINFAADDKTYQLLTEKLKFVFGDLLTFK